MHYRITKVNHGQGKRDDNIAYLKTKNEDINSIEGLQSVRMIAISETESIALSKYENEQQLTMADEKFKEIMGKILILNGPNLNLLGEREPEIYGYESLNDISSGLNEVAKEINVELSHQQFNSEAELIEEIHLAKKDKVDFIIFNPDTVWSNNYKDEILKMENMYFN